MKDKKFEEEFIMKQYFTKVKDWVVENKGKVIGVGLAVAGAVAYGVYKHQSDEECELISENDQPVLTEQNFDPGDDCEMIFTKTDGTVLGKIGCSESYVNDMMELEDAVIEDNRT